MASWTHRGRRPGRPGGHQTGAAGRGGAGEPGPALPGFTLEDAEAYEAEKEPLRRRVEAAETDIENVDTLERYSQLRRKDDFGGQFLASYDMGRLGQDEAKAWSDYLSNPTESNRAYAEGLSLARELFAEHNAAVLDEDATLPLISQSMAGYLPQFLDQTAGRACRVRWSAQERARFCRESARWRGER